MDHQAGLKRFVAGLLPAVAGFLLLVSCGGSSPSQNLSLGNRLNASPLPSPRSVEDLESITAPDLYQEGGKTLAAAESPDLPPIPRDPTPPVTYFPYQPGKSLVVIYDLSFLPTQSNGDLISLKHTLDAFGIPYVVTQDINLATKAREMLIVAGRLSEYGIPDSGLRKKIARKLAKWARKKGRTLWVSFASDSYFLSKIGVRSTPSTSTRDKILLTPGKTLTKYVDTPEEEEIWLAKTSSTNFVLSRSYLSTGSKKWQLSVFGVYPDGENALVVSQYKGRKGRVVLFGVKFNDLLTRMENKLNKKHTRGSTNVFEPSADIVRLIIRAGYEEWTRDPQTRPFAPEGKKAAVLLTHDIDATSGFVPLRDLFLPLEEGLGVRSTLFVTTSYRSNGWIGPFYTDPANQAILADALERGFPLESHSVSHLPDMSRWPIGDPIDDPSQYSPHYDTSTGKTTGGMVLPELLISAKLLEEDFDTEVKGWRSGHLTAPKYFGSLLAATGYWFASNMEAGRVGGSFPYLMMADYFYSGEEVPVLEFPLAISDSKISTRPPEETTQLWLEVTQKNKANNAPTVILVHPTRPDEKYPPYADFLAEVTSDPDLWVGSISDYYQWYREQGIRSEVMVSSKKELKDLIKGAGKGSSRRSSKHRDHDDDNDEHGPGHHGHDDDD